MTVHHQNDHLTLHHGECLDVLRTLPDESVHTVVTDPPYGLSDIRPELVTAAIVEWATGDREVVPDARGFMGNRWDKFVPPPAVWDECMRVLKPGGHVLAFAGSRTYDLMGLSIRMAGFEIRDGIAWLYASGMPKSLDVAKAIDKRPGIERHPEFKAELKAAREAAGMSRSDLAEFVVGTDSGAVWNWEHHQFPSAKWWPAIRDRLGMDARKWDPIIAEAERAVTGKHKSGLAAGSAGLGAAGVGGDRRDAPATPAAAQWQGWGTALKPSFEPIVVARKPIVGTVAANVLAHGTGALNIDATRVGESGGTKQVGVQKVRIVGRDGTDGKSKVEAIDKGRWTPNVELDAEVAELLDAESGVLKSGKMLAGQARKGKAAGTYGEFAPDEVANDTYGDEGGASRFFPVHAAVDASEVDCCPDCNGEDAEPVEPSPDLPAFLWQAKAPGHEKPTVDGVKYPTVKPLTLMQRMVRLVTPPGGTVLEPFAGSGTTVEAVLREGFTVIACEREADYLPLIMQRVKKDHPQSLFGDLFGEDGAA